ncbi:MAG: hypothetical protein KatS3mg129_1266 [Leptospiraceae bacterium]|nr:MAG: hypothetical protein KatS3mg129_1266 [Leptospiraceae bacterium]
MRIKCINHLKKYLIYFILLILPLVVELTTEFLPYLWNIEPKTILDIEYLPNFIFSYGILFILLNIIIFFTRKFKYIIIYWIVILFLIFLLQYINIQKIIRLREPLSINDLFLLKEALFVIKSLDLSYFLPVLIILFLVFILFVFVAYFFNSKTITLKFRIFILFLILLFSITLSIKAKNRHIGNNIFWGNYFNYLENGFYIYLANNILNYRIEKPENYNKEAIKLIIDKLQKNYITNNKLNSYPKSNLILILNETLWEITTLPKIKKAINQDVLSFVHSQNILKFNFYVPFFALGTANTEFEVLTGLSMKFFNFLVTPYTQYINQDTFSLAHILKKYDYYSWVVHANSYWFYKRHIVYKLFGFNKYYSIETLPVKLKFRDNYITYDKKVYDFILKKLIETPQKDFVFYITIQNHHPYDFVLDDKKKIIKNINLSELTASEKKEVVNYLNLLAITDNDIKKLYHSIQNIHEPTLVILFGDHLPPFPNTIYKKLGLFEMNNDFLYLTPLLIFANYKLNTQIINELQSMPYIKANHLLYFILKLLNINDIYGNFINEANKQTLLTKEDYKLIQYDILFGNKYFYKILNINNLNNHEFSYGDDLIINNVNYLDIDDNYRLLLIQGNHFTPYTYVYLNNFEIEDTFYLNDKYIVAIIKKKYDFNNIINLTLKITDLENKNNILKQKNKNFFLIPT